MRNIKLTVEYDGKRYLGWQRLGDSEKTVQGKIEKVIEIIQNANLEIYVEVWSQDFKFYEPYLFDAYNRGVEIKIVGYGNFNCSKMRHN